MTSDSGWRPQSSAARPLSGVLGLLCLAACAGGEESPGIVVTDSAGVEIVTHRELTAWDDPSTHWSLEPVRTLTSAGSEGEVNFWNPTGVSLLPDGRPVIRDRDDPRIVIFHPGRNAVQQRFGRTGEGPGELMSPGGIWMHEGHFIVPDNPTARISHFTPEGELLAVVPLELVGQGRPWTWRYDPVHGELYAHLFAINMAEGTIEYRDRIVRVDPDSGHLEHVMDMLPREPLPPGGLPGMVSFHSRLTWQLLPGGTLVMGRTDLPLFRFHDRSGSLIREVRLPLTNRPVTEADEERIMEEMREEPGIAPYLDRFVSGERWPLYNRMTRVGDTMIAVQHGRWSMAREEPLPGEEVRGVLRLFTVSGRPVGALPYPREIWPLLGEGDRVLAYQDDALGTRNVRIFTLVPPGAPPGR